MRLTACLLLLSTAWPALAQQKLAQDFRGRRFDPESFVYSGPSPDKYLNVEAEGLRLRYTGGNAPPTNNPSGVAWRYHVRGNFVVTAQYEILKGEPPAKGTFLAGAELYLRLDNPEREFIAIARGVFPDGSAALDFKFLAKGDQGKRVMRDYKRLPTTERSLRGRLRLKRDGPIVTASFAEGEDTTFTELQRSKIGTADILLVRFAGIAGGDAGAVLDLRLLEFQLEGDALGLEGKFATPPKLATPKPVAPESVTSIPKKEVPPIKADAPQAIPENVTQPEPAPGRSGISLRLAVILSLLVLAGIVAIGLLLRSRGR